MPLLNYTTSIDAFKTIAEIQQLNAHLGHLLKMLEAHPGGIN